MLKEKNPLLKLKIKKEKTLYNKLLNNIIQAIYALFELILDDPIENLWFEISSLFICYIQIIMFIFNETVSQLFSINIIYSFYLYGIKLHSSKKFLVYFN